KPGLQTSVQKSQLRVEEVMIIVQALPLTALQFNMLVAAVAMDLVRPAWLDATEHGDQSRADSVARRDLTGAFLLALRTAGQILQRSPGCLGGLLGGRANLLGHAQGVGLKVLQQQVHLPQITEHAFHAGEQPLRSTKAQPVEAAQAAQDVARQAL